MGAWLVACGEGSPSFKNRREEASQGGRQHAPPCDGLGVKNKQHQRGSVRDQYIPASLQGILTSFAGCFTRPSFENFVAIVSGWILCQGRHCISRVIQVAGGPGRSKHFATLYRFLSRARWVSDAVGQVLFQSLLPWLSNEVEAVVDDTLCHRSGPHMFGAGMHHDASRSTYGKGSSAGRLAFFSFGQCWVVLAVRLPLPWDRLRGRAIPILFRLYRPKRHCPQGLYRKRTELAVELIKILESWIPSGFRLFVSADAEYACRTVVPRLSKTTTFVGPMNMEASLYGMASSYSGLGRPRKRGARLPSPRRLAAEAAVAWKRVTIHAYGRRVEVLTKTCTCLWYRVNGTRMVKMVLTRDPRRRIEDRAYFSTDSIMTIEELLQRFSRRWTIEVCFRDAKQFVGLEDAQNGWGRRKTSPHRRAKRPGPQARGRRGEIATLHTVPIVFVSYAVVVLWYLQNGQYKNDLHRARERAPWYRSKRMLSFSDMLDVIRRETWAGRLLENPQDQRARRKLQERLCGALLAA